MAAAGGDEDKTEQATPFKLEEARRQGQVAKSSDLSSLGLLAVFLVAVFAMSPTVIEGTLRFASRLLSAAGQVSLSIPHAVSLGRWYSTSLLELLSPLLVMLAVAGIAINLLLVGPVLSFKPLSPDFTRLNPAQGFKRVFSLRTLYDTTKTIFKVALLMVAAYAMITAYLGDLISLSQKPIGHMPHALVRIGGLTLFALLGALLIVGLVDAIYTRWDFLRMMRMSTRELRDEVRRREGDPKIKSKRRELLAKLRRSHASAGRVKDASLLIVNPTHLAVALHYRSGMSAPRLVSKGAGDLARRMRAVAFRHRVPVVEDPALARSLYKLEIDALVPPSMYEAVAAQLRRAWDIGSSRVKAHG